MITIPLPGGSRAGRQGRQNFARLRWQHRAEAGPSAASARRFARVSATRRMR